MSNVRIIHGDSLEAMKAMPDKAYELAICDPEYGADIKGPCGRLERYGGLKSVNGNPPIDEYFTQLFRVSCHAIVWGANYFKMPPCKCFIVWDKKQPQTASYAQAEYAWTNLDGTAKIFEKRIIGADNYRIHPTQKPVALYQWLLKNYAKPGDKILDTHGGSCSIAIACDIMGFDADIYEIDEDYYRAAVERFERHKQQTVLEFST